jgi:membrane-bound serine protease (ClpP class)
VLPGTFVAGFLGLVLMLAALTLSLQGFTVPDPQMPWEMNSLVDNFALTLGMAALALLIPLLAVRFVLPHLPRQASVVSTVTMADAHGASADLLPLHIGQAGMTPTGLRPSGKAFFDGVSYEVSSRGEFIEAGSAVEIVRIHGRAVVVQLLGDVA